MRYDDRSLLGVGIVETDLLVGLARRLVNSSCVRVRSKRLPRAATQALACHCHEEMSTLASFLPELYAREATA